MPGDDGVDWSQWPEGREGFQRAFGSNATEAIEQIRSGKPDLIDWSRWPGGEQGFRATFGDKAQAMINSWFAGLQAGTVAAQQRGEAVGDGLGASQAAPGAGGAPQARGAPFGAALAASQAQGVPAAPGAAFSTAPPQGAMSVPPDRLPDLLGQPRPAAVGVASAVAPLLRGGRDIPGLIGEFAATEDLVNFAVASRGVRGSVAKELTERRAESFDSIRAEVADLHELPLAQALARLAAILGSLPPRLQGDPADANSRAGWLRNAVCAHRESGRTALHYAAEGAQVELVDLLMAAGANLRATTDDGSSVLHWAAGGHVEMVDHLLKAGANVRATNRYGDTPLHWAVLDGHAAIVNRLLEARPDLDAVNINGETALRCAIRGGHVAIADRLVEEGANPRTGNTAMSTANRHRLAEAPARRLPPPSSPGHGRSTS